MSVKPMTSNDKQILGCALGCFGVAVVVLLVVMGSAYYSIRFGRFSAAPRVNTAATVGLSPALVLRMTPDAPTAFSPTMLENPGINTYNGALLRMFVPYEGTISLAPAAEGTRVEFAAAVSMRRGASIIIDGLKNARKDLEANGRTITQLEQVGDGGGLAIVRGTLPLPPEAPGLRAEGWPAPYPGDAPTLDGTHFLEFALDNRNGDAALALAGLIQALGGEDAAEAPAAEAFPPVPDLQTPVTPLSLLSQVRIIKGLKFVKSAWLAADFKPNADLDISLRVSGADEVSAMFLMTGLDPLPDDIRKELGDKGVALEGDITRDGAEIKGELHFVGLGDMIRKGMNDYNDRSNGEVPAWLPFSKQKAGQ